MNDTPNTQELAATPIDVTALQVTQGNPYLPMIDRFLAAGGDIDKLDKILDLKDRWDRSEAEKAYNAAKAAFKANPPDVYKDKKNNQYGSQYTSIGNMVNTVSAALSPHGLSASWDIDQSDAKNITVTCILVHAMGHRESVKMSGPPDDTGQKNALQKIKSTVTYLKLATFEAVTGVASKEGNLDDDGNGSGSPANVAVATAAANREAAAKAKHDEVVGRLSESIDYIKDRIKKDDAAAAAAEWRQFSQDQMQALWIAPSKGGIFTTAEREYLKTKLPPITKEQAQ
jgi:hypothetical protein